MSTTRTKKQDHRTRVGRERSAKTEARILDAALRVFAEMGPDAPRIDDFVSAAGISRGTFYNYFDDVESLLTATSEWTTGELIRTIQPALSELEGPALRFGVGLRIFLGKAFVDAVWSRFVARMWKLGGLEIPARDLAEGLRQGVFHAPSLEAARDLVLGGVREALLRMGSERMAPDYPVQMAEMSLQALGTPRRLIVVVTRYDVAKLLATGAV